MTLCMDACCLDIAPIEFIFHVPESALMGGGVCPVSLFHKSYL